MSEATSTLYDRAAGDWARQQPVLLSDYTARPFVLAACEPIRGLRVLDLGCGEGYVARQFAARGAQSILAYDISEGMIDQARRSENAQPQGIDYRVGDAAAGLDLPEAGFDLAIAVFLFNYLDTAQTGAVMRSVHRALRPGGRFVCTVPHPLLPFFRAKERPFWFDRGEHGYFDGRNVLFEGRIWRRDGVDVPVRCVHKTFADYFDAMRAAGFSAMPKLTELRVTEAHLELDPAFFGPLREQPLHVMFELTR
jgi:SAM-dependent methyltransferase